MGSLENLKLEPMTEKEEVLAVNSSYLHLSLGVDLGRRSLRLPKTLASDTNLRLNNSKAQPGPCGTAASTGEVGIGFTFYRVLGTKLIRSKNFLSILSSEH